MKVRIVSQGWETFTGSLGFQAMFENGVSVSDLTPRQIARIGSSLRIVDVETGDQIGPAEAARLLQSQTFAAPLPVKTLDQVKVEDAISREALAAAEKERRAAEAEAFEAAKRKADAGQADVVIYTRVELEAIASNDGIGGLREIAQPLGVKARAISDMIDEILKAQNKQAAA